MKSPPLRLAANLRIVPVARLGADDRERLHRPDDDVLVSRPGSRDTALAIGPEVAQFLEHFREPRTVVESVVLHSRRLGRDPEEVLRELYPAIRLLLARRFLEPLGTDGSLRPTFAEGETIESFEVVRLLSLMEDTEVYQVRLDDGRPAALKIGREGSARRSVSLEREATILRRLDGSVTPPVLKAGRRGKRPFLVLEWCEGIDALTAAAEWRSRGERESRRVLLALARSVVAAYRHLHAQKVVHGDVNAGNILVDRRGETRLVDFGLARVVDEGARETPPRGGIPIFFEPECARALLSDDRPPPCSETGEQYSLAALLYRMISGRYHVEFSFERRELLRQIVEEPPLAFADHGLAPWPELEEVLVRALAKEPAGRFASLADLASRLDSVRADTAPSIRRGGRKQGLDGYVDELLLGTALEGPWLSRGLPRDSDASFYLGAGGVAYALYRIASLRGDPALLSLADVWIARASQWCDESPLEPTRGPFNGRGGIEAVRALIGAALAEPMLIAPALEAFLDSADPTPVAAEGVDLTHGWSGYLLAAALLLDCCCDELDPSTLVASGDRALARLWAEIDTRGPIADTSDHLGIAHGWAGFLYATLQWSRATGVEAPGGLTGRLDELAALARPAGRGVVWPWRLPAEPGPEPETMPGWCNGSAGQVFLWTLAAELLEEPTLLDLAIGAGWDAWDSLRHEASSCCGLVGRAYAMLCLRRHTGDQDWLERARTLATAASRSGQFDDRFPASLYRGRTGLALLAVDLEDPGRATMPFFEREV